MTLAKVAQSKTSPDPLPTEYHGFVNLLRQYFKLVRHLAEECSGHLVEIMQITAELNLRQFVFEALKADQVALRLWQFFMDARRFCSTGIDTRGNLPQSLLRTTYNVVAVGIMQAHLNVPYAQLMGNDPSEESSGYPEMHSTGGAMPSPGPRTFHHVPASIKAILRGVRSKYPLVMIAELMAAHLPALQYTQVKPGPSGLCLDYLCFGMCKSNGCPYKHEVASADRAEAVAPKLGAAYKV